MTTRKYPLPSFLIGSCSQEEYSRWLHRKAIAHIRRDRKRGNTKATIEGYKIAIHGAVEKSVGNDSYTGNPLRWDLISKYDNDDSKDGGRVYKKDFGDLPTVDHVDDGMGSPDFKICSWRINDAKNDLSYDEFIDVCRQVLKYYNNGK